MEKNICGSHLWLTQTQIQPHCPVWLYISTSPWSTALKTGISREISLPDLLTPSTLSAAITTHNLIWMSLIHLLSGLLSPEQGIGETKQSVNYFPEFRFTKSLFLIFNSKDICLISKPKENRKRWKSGGEPGPWSARKTSTATTTHRQQTGLRFHSFFRLFFPLIVQTDFQKLTRARCRVVDIKQSLTFST